MCGVLCDCGALCSCACVCVLESSLFVALSVVRIRGMRVMMCEAVVFCARATLRLTPHSQPNVFLILSIPHRQSASSDSSHIHMKLTHKHVHMNIHFRLMHAVYIYSHSYICSKHKTCTLTAPHAQSRQSAHIYSHIKICVHTHLIFSFLATHWNHHSIQPPLLFFSPTCKHRAVLNLIPRVK